MKASKILFLVFLSTILLCVVNVQPVKAQFSGTIYIRADGTVDPTTAPIQREGNVYTLTDNIVYQSIVVEKDDIVVDGAGYTLQGTGVLLSKGIDLTGRSNVTIKNVKIKAFWCGIYLSGSSNNTVSGNNATNNGHGISLRDSSNYNTISGNNITENGDDGIWLLRSSNNNTVSGNNVTANNLYGIQLSDSSNNIIYGNDITANIDYGIDLSGSNNTIYGNNIANNLGGIQLSGSNNIIYGNDIIANNQTGISFVFLSSNNIIYGNKVVNNHLGISLSAGMDNSIYNNNFMDNTGQVSNFGSINIWDDGYPSGGNYWSNYNGTDFYRGPQQDETGSDGIGDTSYRIDFGNWDNYPLMGMFSDFSATPEHDVQTICNSSISDFQYNGTAICFNVTGENGTTGFCRICIPTGLMNDTYRVFVNGTEVSCTLLPCSNATHNYLYFTYNHSTKEVVIVPEFPTWTSILLILIVLTVAVAIYKGRLPKKPIQ